MDIPLEPKPGSCIPGCYPGELKENALHFLRNKDLGSFMNLLSEADVEGKEFPLPSDHWINEKLDTEDGKTLLDVAILDGKMEFVQGLLRAGAKADHYNAEIEKCPIHLAVATQNKGVLEILLRDNRNKANVNAICKAKSGQTALHMCADQNWIDGVRILINDPNLEVDLKDSSGGKTPLYVAVKKGHKEIAIMLIEAGADYHLRILGKRIYPDLMQSTMPNLDPTSLNRKRVPLVKQFNQSVFDKLVKIIETTAFERHLYQIQMQELGLLLRQIDIVSLNKKDHNGYTLLQLAADSGLEEVVGKILEIKGVDPDSTTDTAQLTPLLLAASRGHANVLEVLMEHQANLTYISPESQESVLHCMLKYGPSRGDYVYECIETLFKSRENQSDLQLIINKRDVQRNTPLHYAVQKWPSSVVRILLVHGANIGMKNQWGELPIEKIRPETLEEFLDEHCIQSKLDVNDDDFELTFDYSFLAPLKDDLPLSSLPTNTDDPEVRMISNSRQYEKIPLPETQSLWYMGQSKTHRHLLKHPVVTSFLFLKWGRIRKYFNRNLRFYLLLVCILTWYIFDQFAGVSLRSPGSKTIPFLHGSFIFCSCLILLFIIRDWGLDLKDILREEKMKNPTSKTERLESSGTSITKFILRSWVEVFYILGMGFLIITGETYLWQALLMMTIILTLREFFQALVSLKRYIASPENWLEASLIVLIALILGTERSDYNYELKRHLSAIAIVLSWAELITLVGKHPKLSKCNVYVTMFYKVMATFCFFLCWYVFFILAFALGFYIMLHKDGPNDVPGEDDYVYFNKPWLAMVKTTTMFVGELEFSDIPINIDSQFGPLGYLFFLCFVFLIVVVLMNLLNGLAVSDTGAIQEKAEIVSYISRVETISYTESVLLGDPFDFLSNWPKWLLRFPSCSICTQLYKSKAIQRWFNKLSGATGILLFYKILPDKKLTLQPNTRKSGCNCLEVELMDESIILSAKSVILKRNNVEMEERLEQVEKNIEQRISSLESKIDALITKLASD